MIRHWNWFHMQNIWINTSWHHDQLCEINHRDNICIYIYKSKPVTASLNIEWCHFFQMQIFRVCFKKITDYCLIVFVIIITYYLDNRSFNEWLCIRIKLIFIIIFVTTLMSISMEFHANDPMSTTNINHFNDDEDSLSFHLSSIHLIDNYNHQPQK